MTTKEAKAVLHHPSLDFVLVALSYVNLTDRETDTLILRHLRGHTQEETADELKISVNCLKNIEKDALNKCASVWKDLEFIRIVMKATR